MVYLEQEVKQNINCECTQGLQDDFTQLKTF